MRTLGDSRLSPLLPTKNTIHCGLEPVHHRGRVVWLKVGNSPCTIPDHAFSIMIADVA